MEQLLEKVKSKFWDAKLNGDELTPKYCPFCEGGKNHDKYTFSVNIHTGAYNCLRGSCGEKGSIYDLAKHLNIENTHVEFREYKKKKTYTKPEYIHHELTKEVIDYFKLRGISQETLINNNVTTDNNGNIQFNYYRDGELVFVKYKLPRKPKNGESKSWRMKGGEPILYGMDNCDYSKPLIIIEGEPDKLVLDECGIENAVSIPSGTKDISWINNCWEWMENFNELIIWGDNDKAGIEFTQEVIKRLDYWKLKIVKCEEKDANTLLYKQTKQAVIDCVKNASVVTSDFMIDMANVKRKDYHNTPTIKFGFKDMDKLLGGALLGQLIVWTGFNGSGKSTILGQAVLNGMEEGNKAFIYSGELPKEDVKEWLDLQLLGKEHLSSYRCPVKEQNISIPNPKYFDDLDDFYRDMLFIYDTDDYSNDVEVFKAMEYMVKRENVKQIMLDNLMSLPLKGNGDINEKTKNLISRLKNFCRKFNVVIHLVAHQRKPQTGEEERPTKYGIAGTAGISDWADRTFGVHRLSKSEMASGYSGYNTIIIAFKDRKYGVYNEEIKFGFEYHSKRYYTNEAEKNKEYLWKTGKQEQWEESLDNPF